MSNRKITITRKEFLRLLELACLAGMAGCVPGRTVNNIPKPTHVMPTKAAQVKIAEEAQEYQPEVEPSQQTGQQKEENLPKNGQAYLGVARGESPSKITMAALAAIGGIERFVKPGMDVIVKPNICTDYYSYEYGATTNPEVIATLVKLCLGAGANRVRVMDQGFGGSPDSAYERSGIGPATRAAGGEIELMNRNKFVNTPIPEGKDIKEWMIYHDIMTADVLIDVPIAKHHGLSKLSLAGKNLLGVIQRPSMIHANLGQRIADLVSAIRPTLTVVDAVRTLMSNGPTGGNLDDVRMTNTVIASHDIVAADAYASTLFGLQGSNIAYIQAAADMQLGTMDLTAIKIEEINV